MKKLAVIATAMMMVLTGCGGTQKTEGSSPSPSESQVENSKPEESSPSSEEKPTESKGQDTSTEGSLTEADLPELYQLQLPEKGEEIAVVKTSEGEIRIRFFPNEAPKAVENFVTHAKEGYYDGIKFHRVVDGFMIQGGDPLGTGAGGESIWGQPFEDEISPKLHHLRGAVAMANSGRNTNGSQFFINQAKTAQAEAIDAIRKAKEEQKDLQIQISDTQQYSLEEMYPEEVLKAYEILGGPITLEPAFGGVYTVFGQVFKGMEVVDKIAATQIEGTEKPGKDIVIEAIEIIPYEGEE